MMFSKNEEYIISSSKDKSVCIWDIKNGKVIHNFKKHRNDIINITCLSDGINVLSADCNNKTNRINIYIIPRFQ